MAKKVPVMEMFGPTIQGEGIVTGRKTMFVRTAGCDYACAWCDSAFTWNGTERGTLLTAQDIWTQFEEMATVDGVRNFNHITITGGNPALYNEPIDELIDIAHAHGVEIGLETQGSRWQPWFLKVDDLTISPKPPSSTMTTDWAVLDEIVEKLGNHSFSMKVVVFDEIDFDYAQTINRRYALDELYLSVGNDNATEAGDISSRLLQKLDWLWQQVLATPAMNNAKPLPQLHALVWANQRGV
ncbi:7-carboxy-7-deazaguanine synthase QueE [Kurthia massiliensis]|uniref:7-carboxy-7-deazaguanine synthase QueE n=1 Tax=Kurthia massiliensis TaxID=1033739 RepID=UPI000288BB60|nr:7-carboxy-7-deazaguanine synthase QueE [Kurthia massiliensis]